MLSLLTDQPGSQSLKTLSLGVWTDILERIVNKSFEPCATPEYSIDDPSRASGCCERVRFLNA